MKLNITLITLLLMTNVGKAQFQTQKFVNSIPSPPNDICKTSADDRQAFVQKVSTFQIELDEQIKKNRRASRVDGNYVRNEALKQMATQYGLSDTDVQKMKSSKKMSAEDKAALANKMMQQQANVSLGEVKNLQKMSNEGRKAWAQAYSAEAFAMAQGKANDSGQKPPSNSVELAQQLQQLNAQVQQRRENISDEYKKIIMDPQRIMDEQKILAWNAQFSSLIGANGGQGEKMDSIALQVKNAKELYCEKYTARYLKVLNDQYKDVSASYNDYIRIADLTRLVANSQPVKVNLPQEKEMEYLEYIKVYLIHLSAVFNYQLK